MLYILCPSMLKSSSSGNHPRKRSVLPLSNKDILNKSLYRNDL